MAEELPGRIAQKRLNYGLNENVVLVDVLDQVRVSKQQVNDSRPDVLGLRGPQWQATTRTTPGKHCQVASDRALSNTLLAQHIHPTDFRKSTGSTYQPVERQAATVMGRNQPGAMGSWNASTYVERREVLAGAEVVTARSISATRARQGSLLASGYTSPLQLSALVSERVRDAKAVSGDTEGALELLYGAEGAASLRETMKRPGWDRPPGQRQRGRATAADLAAVAALPDDVQPAATTNTEEGEEEGEEGEEAGVTAAEATGGGGSSAQEAVQLTMDPLRKSAGGGSALHSPRA